MIDLHTHTVRSDGADTTAILLQNCEKEGISVLSITDHDSVGAYKDLPAARHLFSGKIIPGTELSAMVDGEICEVLGYGIDTDIMSGLIKEHVTPFISSLPQQSVLYMKAFAKYGVRFTPEFEYIASKEPEKLFEDSVAYSQLLYLNDMRKFPENARFFDSYEHMMTISPKDFSRLYIYNPKSTLYVDLSPIIISIERAIELIHKAGGKAFFAHTYVYSESISKNVESIIKRFPLDGIEAYYPTFTAAQSEYLVSLAKKYGLLISGGSDYHSLSIKPDNFLGKGTEGAPLSEDIISPWLNTVKTI
ncbi:MAG: PHP domain-containing protein [Clostridia bacterium]|nr:PHP domain-containing protein [Clostridia bacterium]